MRRPELARAALGCALALASALVPLGGARAAMGSLYRDLVCRDLASISGEFDFKTSFVGIASCKQLCLDAVLVCERDVKDAASCQMAFASDWIAFDSKLDCNGLTRSRLRDCKDGWAIDKKAWLDQIKNARPSALFGCGSTFSTCVSHCSGI